jgi:hypothetical protein
MERRRSLLAGLGPRCLQMRTGTSPDSAKPKPSSRGRTQSSLGNKPPLVRMSSTDWSPCKFWPPLSNGLTAQVRLLAPCACAPSAPRKRNTRPMMPVMNRFLKAMTFGGSAKCVRPKAPAILAGASILMFSKSNARHAGRVNRSPAALLWAL